MHVIRQSDGTGGQSASNVDEVFNILQTDFEGSGISFVWDGVIDHIDDTCQYREPRFEFLPDGTLNMTIFDVDGHDDGIDIYLFGDDSAYDGVADGIAEGRTAFLVSGTDFVPPNETAVRSSVLTHEIGHVIGLYHTFHGSVAEDVAGSCAELVDGSNGTTCGDYIPDTPADRNSDLGGTNWPADCDWNSSATDANGDRFDPDLTNYMAYANIPCYDGFSSDQIDRMHDAITNVPSLQATVVECDGDCPDDLLVDFRINAARYSESPTVVSAGTLLTADNTVSQSTDVNVDFTAGERILLLPGFNVERNSNNQIFRAFIDGCTDTGGVRGRIDPKANIIEPPSIVQLGADQFVLSVPMVEHNDAMPASFAIYSVTGQLMTRTESTSTRSIAISTHLYPPGIYFAIQVSETDGILGMPAKLVVQR